MNQVSFEQLSTVEPDFTIMARGQQNHILKSRRRCKRTPDLTIWRQSR